MSSALDRFLGDEIPAQAAVQETAPLQAVPEQDEDPAEDAPQEAAELQDSVPREDHGTEQGRKVPLPALLEERRRRQESDEKLRQIEQKLKELEHRHPAPPPPPEPEETYGITDDVYADIPAAMKALAKNLRDATRADAERARREDRMVMSVEMAKLQFKDYSEVVNQSNYETVIKENPAIYALINQSHNPGAEAYRLIKGHLDSKKAVTPDKIQELVEAETQKRLQEELAKRGLSQAAQIPPSLAAARGSGVSKREAEWNGPPSLKEIMDGRKKRR